MTAPTIFQFQAHEVRTIIKDGEPWFVAADVARALDYRDAEVAARHLDDDEKVVHLMGVPAVANGKDRFATNGATQRMTIINESGLYALVLRSRKPEARKFAKWVTSEVLPSIRKTGGYQFVRNSGDVLSIEQADLLRQTMTAHCAHLPKQQQGAFMVKGWSKLKSHFKVGYRQIPQEQLVEALSIVTRHAADWEVVDELPAQGPTLKEMTRNNIEALCSQMEFLRSWFARVDPGLKLLHPRLASAGYDHFIDGVCLARNLVKDLSLRSDREYAAGYPWDGGYTDRLDYNRSFT